MDDKERLVAWMTEKGYNYRTLAAATGDTISSINMMISGYRQINDAFKFRFWKVFGEEETQKVFGEQMAVAE